MPVARLSGVKVQGETRLLQETSSLHSYQVLIHTRASYYFHSLSTLHFQINFGRHCSAVKPARTNKYGWQIFNAVYAQDYQ